MSRPAREQGPRRPRAVALRYDGASPSAPSVVAKGQGELAQRILEEAHRHGIPVREDADLIELLCACDVGEEIPTELFGAVAELLAFLYRLNGRLGGGEGDRKQAQRERD